MILFYYFFFIGKEKIIFILNVFIALQGVPLGKGKSHVLIKNN